MITYYRMALSCQRPAASVIAAWLAATAGYARWMPAWAADILAASAVLTAFTRVYGRSQA